MNFSCGQIHRIEKKFNGSQRRIYRSQPLYVEDAKFSSLPPCLILVLCTRETMRFPGLLLAFDFYWNSKRHFAPCVSLYLTKEKSSWYGKNRLSAFSFSLLFLFLLGYDSLVCLNACFWRRRAQALNCHTLVFFTFLSTSRFFCTLRWLFKWKSRIKLKSWSCLLSRIYEIKVV